MKLFLCICLSFFSQSFFSQGKKVNAPHPIKITGTVYVTRQILTGVKGAEAPNDPPPYYLKGDTVVLSNKKIFFFTMVNEKTIAKTNRKGFFSVKLLPGKYIVHQSDPLSLESEILAQGMVQISVGADSKYCKIVFINTDDLQKNIPHMGK